MTISSSAGRIQYTGNGATTNFATNFKLLDEDHVEVYVDGTLKTISTDYTITGVGNSTATVVFNSAPANATTVTLKLEVPITQDTDLVNGQAFNADTVEQALDLGIQVDQGLNEEINRTLRAPVDVTTSFNGELGSITAEYILRVNSAGDGFEVQPPEVAAGIGTLGTQDADAVAITGGTIAGTTITGSTIDGLDFSSLTQTEIDELQTIGATTISSAQWGYLGAMAGQPLESFDVVDDTTPQLGGNLDINGNSIVSVSAGDIAITPDTSGKIILDGLNWPTADGTNGQVIITDGAGQLSFSAGGGGGGLGDIVDDTTPQLGGQLDVNGNAIGDGSLELLSFTEDASAVNHVNIENEATGSGPIISSTGDDTNVDLNISTKGSGTINLNGNVAVTGTLGGLTQAELGELANIDSVTVSNAQWGYLGATTAQPLENVSEDTTPQLGGDLDVNGNSLVSTSNGDITLTPNGTGDVVLGNFTLDADQTVGAGQDNFVLTYDNSGGKIALEAAGGGGMWEEISTATASASASIEFTGLSSSYKKYKVVMTDVKPSANANMEVRLSNDGGSTYEAGSTYYEYIQWGFGTTSVSVSNSTGADHIEVAGINMSNATNDSSNLEVDITNHSSSGFTGIFAQGLFFNSGSPRRVGGSGSTAAAEVNDAIQFIPSSGTITSGTFKLYGLA